MKVRGRQCRRRSRLGRGIGLTERARAKEIPLEGFLRLAALLSGL